MTTRPPLTRGSSSPAIYCRERDRTPDGAGVYSPRHPLSPLIPNQGGSHGRFGSLDGVPTSPYPTPHTASPPLSSASTPDSDENMPHSAAPPSYFPRPSPAPDVPIVSIRGSRSPTEDDRAQPAIHVSSAAYSMVAHIGRGFHPECITISAKRGNALVIVADRWDMEKDCESSALAWPPLTHPRSLRVGLAL
ncbi:hypothetical protein CTheo_1663 [Ceratobasidium theobromae]|uniref:Uncharacterized protein n=1 Tax=Ceratobasidium theobromae TaxID=1582974 RepID=A0A5N5QT70_9AGAM|nr:hypothetical protein CTheo_1663 [Ceratobasidium theobromae]